MAQTLHLNQSDLDAIFDDHPSLNASLEDFEEHTHHNHSPRSPTHRPPLFTIPSHHSGFRAHSRSNSESSSRHDAFDMELSQGPWAPPGFSRNGPGMTSRDATPVKKSINPTASSANAANKGPSWYRHQPYHNYSGASPGANARARSSQSANRNNRLSALRAGGSLSRSRETSPQFGEEGHGVERRIKSEELDWDNDVTLPASIPLPCGADSPLKGRSPSPERKGKNENGEALGLEAVEEEVVPEEAIVNEDTSNYIRFALRAEVQHREPFHALYTLLSGTVTRLTKSRSTTILSIVVALCSLTFLRLLFSPPPPPPVPDMIKLSSLARSFEPLIFYSENGVAHVSALQDTSVAVWDLGESVRTANMTSGPIIVDSLDNLSESLKTLAMELTRFFANVDADVDSILIVMEWARRELETLSHTTLNKQSTPRALMDNVHAFLQRFSLLENPQTNTPTPLGTFYTTIFGPPTPLRTRQTLTRTFLEFLSILEESIASELSHSTALFALFESIDRQFLNLQRSVVREADTQDGLEREVLASLWQRLWPNERDVKLRKFEKNRHLLRDVRARTVENKGLLMDHRSRLLTLKSNLEALRRKLVSPLVRRNASALQFLAGASGNTMMEGEDGGVGVDYKSLVQSQIQGLEGSYTFLKGVRETQKRKLLEIVYGAGSVRRGIVRGEGEGGSNGRWEEVEGR